MAGSSKMYITTAAGIMKTATIVAGLIIMIVAAVYFHFKGRVEEGYLFGVTISFLLLSIFSLVAGVWLTLKGTRKYIDVGYHVVGGIFILVAGILIITNYGDSAVSNEVSGNSTAETTTPKNLTGTQFETSTLAPGNSTSSNSTFNLTDENTTTSFRNNTTQVSLSTSTSTGSPASPGNAKEISNWRATLATGVLSILNAILYFAVAAVSLL